MLDFIILLKWKKCSAMEHVLFTADPKELPPLSTKQASHQVCVPAITLKKPPQQFQVSCCIIERTTFSKVFEVIVSPGV